MKLIVGLGNPGPEYTWSRHNVGWLLIDSFVSRADMPEPRAKFSGAFWSPSQILGGRVAFLKPFTYMNLSGKSVAEAAHYYDIPASDILVVFDDAALPFGKLRYRASGSAGGQKGMMSIIAMLGTPDIPRLRAGIDAPPPQMDMKDWVLGRFPKEQRDDWHLVEDLAWTCLERWMIEAGESFTAQIDGARKDKP
ncbi:peptidyl-tRNA hydrolase [Synergistales bacterium]|nr:peptidyl-tRNA hydrolase [Synergistales bacterium]